MDYEPGPESPAAAEPMPPPPPFEPTFETLAAPVVASLDVEERALVDPQSTVASAGSADLDGEFAIIVDPAIREVEAQLGTLYTGDPEPAAQRLEESIGESDATIQRLPDEHAPEKLGTIEGEGTNPFGETDWVEHDELPHPTPEI